MIYEHESIPADEEHRQQRELVQPDAIPQGLVAYPQWVCWRYGDHRPNKKPDKRPINPHNLRNAGVNWPATWSTFEHALATCASPHSGDLAGIGFVLTRNDPFVGIDIDGCIEDSELLPTALNVVVHLQSYTEVSPSGVGLRIMVACPELQRNRRTSQLEVYAHSRFLTLTGNHLQDAPQNIATIDRERLATLLPSDLKWEPEDAHVQPFNNESLHPKLDDIELWERIFTYDRYGAQHRQRFDGDISLDRDDHSLCVIRLLNTLARWTGGDASRMRSLMLISPLANDKWFSKRGQGDWLDHQISDSVRFIHHRR